jgi:Cd(II)/Pb(II)-responsive transcriptional regulator
MKIGELSEASGTPIETIRFYEREGLVPAPARTASNYRTYEDGHVQRLAFIRRCRSLDMALDEVRALLRFRDAPSDDCGEVNKVLDEHIGHVTERVRELRALERQLRELRAQCQSTESGDACGILEQLSQPPLSAQPTRSLQSAHAHVGSVHGRPARAAKR